MLKQMPIVVVRYLDDDYSDVLIKGMTSDGMSVEIVVAHRFPKATVKEYARTLRKALRGEV